jgi:deoxyribonuclease-4
VVFVLSPVLPAFNPRLRVGAHMPTAGGLFNALLKGKEVGCDVVQIFTKSPQQWNAKALTDEDVEKFLSAQQETGIRCLAAHDSYLINPASADPEMLQKSRNALTEELERGARLHLPFVVMHQGAIGAATEDEALGRLIDSVRYALEHSPEDGPTLLLENTAGQGKCLGYRFEQIARVLEGVDAGSRLGVCLDTCHVFAAGYDIRDVESYEATMAEFDRLIGLQHIRMIHANDSKKELGSRVDRHEAIGKGHIGPVAFQQLLTDPRLMEVPVLLETPKDDDMDAVNLAALRRAAGLLAEVEAE